MWMRAAFLNWFTLNLDHSIGFDNLINKQGFWAVFSKRIRKNYLGIPLQIVVFKAPKEFIYKKSTFIEWKYQRKRCRFGVLLKVLRYW